MGMLGLDWIKNWRIWRIAEGFVENFIFIDF